MKNLPSLSENFRYFLSGVFLCGLVLGSPHHSNSVVGPPSYLLIDGHDKCLSKFRASESHEEVCIPLTKPVECDEVVWAALADDFQALSPHMPSQYPAYLIAVEKACFGKHLIGIELKLCIPHEKPILCSTSSWQLLQQYLHSGDHPIKQCSDSPIYVNDAVDLSPNHPHPPSHDFEMMTDNIEAPAWTRNEGIRDCLIPQWPIPQHSFKVLCLPPAKPEGCTEEAWNSLQSSTDVLPCVRREMLSQHPVYPIEEACFGKLLIGSEPKLCIPHEKPIRCSTSSWLQLQNNSQLFEKCPYSPIYVNDAVDLPTVDSPIYVNDAVDLPTVDSPIYVNDAVDLPTVDSLPQDHLSASGFTETVGVSGLCLGIHLVNNVRKYCMRVSRPPGCPKPIWEQLRNYFIAGHLKLCQSQEDVAFVPSKFHNVPGFTGCITFDNTNFTKCLPVTPPVQCEHPTHKMMQYLAFQTTEAETGTSTTTDTIEMVRCNCVQDCEQHIVGNKQCSPLGNSGGVCAPQNCDQSGKCPKIGTSLINGQVTGQCNDSNMCVYASVIMIA